MQSPFAARMLPSVRRRQSRPAVPILGIGEKVWRAVGKDQPGADDELEGLGEGTEGGRVESVRRRRPGGNPGIFARPRALADLGGRDLAGLAQFLEGAVGAHHSRDRVAIGDADAGMTEQERRQHHLVGVGRAAQEREVGGGGKLGIAAHAKIPCRNQRGSPSSRP